jgi:hypothetical protein
MIERFEVPLVELALMILWEKKEKNFLSLGIKFLHVKSFWSRATWDRELSSLHYFDLYQPFYMKFLEFLISLYPSVTKI